jgi:hypothetical protein
MAKYFYITAQFVMRECPSEEWARDQLAMHLPRNPDETTKYVESWEITKVRSSGDPVPAGCGECVSCGAPGDFLCRPCEEKRFEASRHAWIADAPAPPPELVENLNLQDG